MKRCPECDKIVYPWEEKVHTSKKTSGGEVYHKVCYWIKKKNKY